MSFDEAYLKTFSQNTDIGRITLMSHLGQGSFATVFLVRMTPLELSDGDQCLFALKMLCKQDLAQRSYLFSIEVEKQIMIDIKHPFVLKLHSTFQCTNYLYLMLEYAPGGTMFELLQRKGRLREDEIKFYACEIVLALEFLHS